MRIALKETNESRIWLEIIVRSDLLPEKRMRNILDEADTLCRILNASIHTALADDTQQSTVNH